MLIQPEMLALLETGMERNNSLGSIAHDVTRHKSVSFQSSHSRRQSVSWNGDRYTSWNDGFIPSLT
jgi:hypothetical protein